jgi:hypothetical protein
MNDAALAALLQRRLTQVQRADITKSFDAASVRAILASLPADVALLPASESPTPTRPALVERLARLQERAEREDFAAEGVKWRLEEVLLSTLSQTR